MRSIWLRFNRWLTDRVSAAYSTVITAYVFTIVSVLPFLFPAWMATILYVSNAIQLDSMAFIGVSSAVGAASTVRLIREMAAAVKEELSGIRKMLVELQRLLRDVRAMLREVRAMHREFRAHFGITGKLPELPPD